MNDETTLQDPAANAPAKARGLLFPLGLASLLLGGVFLLFWYLMGQATDVSDIAATEVETRRWILISIGIFLSLQGVALLLVRFAGSKSLGAGAARNKLVANVILMIALGSALVILVNYVFGRHELWRLDLTTEKLHTLSAESSTLVKNLPSPVRLVLLTPGGEDAGQLERLIDQYQAASSSLRVERYNPRTMDQVAFRSILEELDLSPTMSEAELLGVVVQSGVEEDGVWIKSRSKHLGWNTLWRREMSDPTTPRMVFHGERLISTAVREVTEAEQSKVYVLAGHGELSIEDLDERTSMSQMVSMLRQRNLDVLELNLLDRAKVDVPEDCRVLVIPAPTKALSELELKGIRAYLVEGGRALILLEPLFAKGPGGRTDWSATGLESLVLDLYGIDARDELIFLKFLGQGGRLSGKPQLYLKELAIDHDITRPLALRKLNGLFYGARPLLTRPMPGATKAKALISTKGYGERCFSSTDPTSPQVPGMMRDGPFPVGVAAERVPGDDEPGETSRVVVFGDANWVTNVLLTDRAFANQELLLNSFNWLTNREELNTGEVRAHPSNRLVMTAGTLERLKGLACPGMPAIALALGLFAWMIRART